MPTGDDDKKPDKASDEAVWFSFVCASFAFAAAVRHPSIGISMVLILMVGWFVWTLWQKTDERFY